MNWEHIDSENKQDEIIKLSKERRVLIFMFSRTNTLDHIIKFAIEREWNPGEMEMPTFMLDADNNKNIAGMLADKFGVKVYSPQALIIEKGKPVFSAVDGEINFKAIRNWANPKKIN